MDTKEIAKELGRIGGQKTLKRYGTEHYRKIIQKRWANRQNAPKRSSKKST